jgi:long-chain acyl-CoA synthetase
VRRGFIADRYGPLVEGLYSGTERAHISTVVTFEDGRKGKIEADLAIREAARFEAPARVELRKAG